MDINDYVQHDAVGLAELIATGDVSAPEVQDTARQAIAVVNPDLNAVAGDVFPRVLDHDPAGPLGGVPLGLKDSSPAAIGVVADYACRALAGYVPTSESRIMQRLRAMGLAAIARTTGPELHMYGVTESDVYGITRNPWDLDLSPGGSSGGSAALVAARALPIATAGDAGGSTRMPAGFCGLVGLLPTVGRISYAPAGERLYGLSRPFVLVRSMRDTALSLDLLSGPEPGDRVQVPPPARSYRQELDAPSEKLRIGISTSTPFGSTVDQAAIDGVRHTAATLESLGHEVVDVDVPIDADFVLDTLVKGWSCALSQAVHRAMRSSDLAVTKDLFQPNTWLHIEHGMTQGAQDALDVYDQMNEISRPIGAFFETIDLLITPSTPSLGMPVGEWDGYRPFDDLHHMYRETTAAFEAFQSIWNITGQPAIVLPLAHDDASGLPVATQLIGRWGDESTLIRIGAELERALPWVDRMPPINATMNNRTA